MNVLYIAYSCDPYEGSEDKIGWRVPIESAKTNHVYVITKEEHRISIEKCMKMHSSWNIEFYFVDIPDFYKRIFKGFMYSGRLNIWHRYAFSVVQKICRENHIDIIHQITPVEFRAIGNYGKIQNAKFVCGPVGGGETLPPGLADYAKKHEIVESIRSLANQWARFKLKAAGKLKQCDYIIFANRETRDYLIGNGQQNHTYNVVTEIAIDTPQDGWYKERDASAKKCTFLVAGRMVYRKGHALLLDSLMMLPDDLEYECRIVGGGPEQEKLQARCQGDERLSKHVVFTGPIPYSEMENEYKKADVFIMPSIRETTGTVLLEAMSKGIPVITINKFGGAILIDNESGWLYEGRDRTSYIDSLKNAVLDGIRNPDEIRRRGMNARKNAEQYTWEKKCQYYQKIYGELLQRACHSESEK